MITDEMVEVAARRIFRLWRFQPKDRLRVEWERDGNSEKQDEARLYATAALEAVLPMIRAEVLEEAAKVVQSQDKRKQLSSALPAPWRPDQWLGFGKVD